MIMFSSDPFEDFKLSIKKPGRHSFNIKNSEKLSLSSSTKYL
jgi:hypothetical protein